MSNTIRRHGKPQDEDGKRRSRLASEPRPRLSGRLSMRALDPEEPDDQPSAPIRR